MKAKKVVLMILDGWGQGDKTKSDAIFNANTPFIDGLYERYPHATLGTSGSDVGLPDGQMGNSEVGHLNIGAGRIVYQDLAKINKAVKDGSIEQHPVILDAFEKAKSKGVKLHFFGLVSEGGVHSSQAHLHKLCDMADQYGLKDVFVHAFTDGRDVDPHSGHGYIEQLENHLNGVSAELVSVVGRYYAMDRDKRWERVKKAYDLMVHGVGTKATNLIEAIDESYARGVSDEFIEPIIKVDAEGNFNGRIEEGDVCICFNFRTDRCREITVALTQQDFHEENMHTIDLEYYTMTKYDESFKGVNVIYDKDNLVMTVGETISLAGKKQIRIAETEKYPHVTFFFSGGREEPFENEKRLIAASPKVATYDLQPEMSALEVTDKICAELEAEWPDFVCLNFANPDMVGHTGIYEAVTKALETVDSCAKRVVETGQAHGYSFIIIADHGNADFMINADGSPNTAHTTNPVPIIVVDEEITEISDGILADIGPSVLSMMQIDIPKEITGKVLVKEPVQA